MLVHHSKMAFYVAPRQLTLAVSTRQLLATNGTAVAVGNVYSGATMPAGCTASTLVSVCAPGELYIVSIATAVPPNVRSVNGYVRVSPGSVGSRGTKANLQSYPENFRFFIATVQTIWCAATVSAETLTTSIVLTSHTF